MANTKYNFPVFATQGGGLVREIKTSSGYKYIFVEAPSNCVELGIGDFMPEEWGVVAANQQASDKLLAEELDLDLLFKRDPETARIVEDFQRRL